MSVGTEEAADLDGLPAYDYPEGFAVNDAVYTLHAVEFAPPLNPNVGSIFDDTSADIEQTWERAEKVGDAISSANQKKVERRMKEASETVREVMLRVVEGAQATEAATEEQTDSNS
jgi:hypothetical protein